MSAVTWTVDTSAFDATLRELSNMSGAPEEAIIVEEVGKILENCIRYTPTRSAGQIEATVKFRNRNLWTNDNATEPGKRLALTRHPEVRGAPVVSITKSQVAWYIDQSTYDGRGPAPAGKKIGGKTFHIMNDRFRWSNARWAGFQAALARLNSQQIDLDAAKRSRGIMAHSWYQIAQALGLNIDCPDYVRDARTLRGVVYLNGRAIKSRTPEQFYVEISNDNPILVNHLNGAGILARAIQARVNHFEINLRKGVFDDVKRRAERYPGVFVR